MSDAAKVPDAEVPTKTEEQVLVEDIKKIIRRRCTHAWAVVGDAVIHDIDRYLKEGK